MAPKDKEPIRDKPHMSAVPPITEVQPTPAVPEMPNLMRSPFNTSEPEQPEPVQLRMDNRAMNLLRVLAVHDNTSPTEQVRTATNLYLAVRLGDKAVEQFITDYQKQLQETYALLESYPAQPGDTENSNESDN